MPLFGILDLVSTPYGRAEILNVRENDLYECRLVDWTLASNKQPIAIIGEKFMSPVKIISNGTSVICGTFGQGKVVGYNKQTDMYEVILDAWRLANDSKVHFFAKPVNLKPVPAVMEGDAVSTPYGRGMLISADASQDRFVVSLSDWHLATNGAFSKHPTAYLNSGAISRLSVPIGTKVTVSPYGQGTVEEYRSEDGMYRVRLANWVLAQGSPVDCYVQGLKLQLLKPAIPEAEDVFSSEKLSQASVAATASSSSSSPKKNKQQSPKKSRSPKRASSKEPTPKPRVEESDEPLPPSESLSSNVVEAVVVVEAAISPKKKQIEFTPSEVEPYVCLPLKQREQADRAHIERANEEYRKMMDAKIQQFEIDEAIRIVDERNMLEEMGKREKVIVSKLKQAEKEEKVLREQAIKKFEADEIIRIENENHTKEEMEKRERAIVEKLKQAEKEERALREEAVKKYESVSQSGKVKGKQ